MSEDAAALVAVRQTKASSVRNPGRNAAMFVSNARTPPVVLFIYSESIVLSDHRRAGEVDMMVDVGLDIPELVPALRSTYNHRVPKLYRVTVYFEPAVFALGEEQDA